MNLSPNFTLAEAITSQKAVEHGIDNTPPPHILKNIQYTATYAQKARDFLGHAMHVSSWYRSPELNSHPSIGGSKTSAHCLGYAIDCTCPGFGTPLEVARALRSSGIPFDQIIWERTKRAEWVHISFDPRFREQVLTLNPNPKKGEKRYLVGLPAKGAS